MPERSPPSFGDLDWQELGQAMSLAANAAHIGVHVSIIGSDGPRTVYVNDAVAEISGYSREELLTRDPLASVSPEDIAFVRERAGRRIEGEKGQAHYELNVIRKDGTVVPIEVSTSDVTVGGRRAICSFLVDITARKAAEQSRLRNEARFRELIEKGPEAIGIIRGDHFVYANARLVSMLGRSEAEDLYGTALDELVVTEDVPALRVRMKALSEDETLRTPSQIYRVRRLDGPVIVIEASSVPFEYEGQRCILTMLRDVTERRALEARLVQADRLAALGTMAAGVAHEVNNPLGYLILNLDWISRKLSERPFDLANLDGLTDLLGEARRGAERVATIVRELRSFSRTEGESRHAVDLATVVQSAIRIAGHEIHHRARITTTFGEVAPVWGHEGRIEQVVLNLLLNAAQAMSEASASTNAIHVSVRADGAGRAVLEVADNGAGIPPEILPHIFDPFFTTKPPGVGTGLGLSICHGIVESLGGTVAVHSEPREGTTFRVVFPTTYGLET